MKKISPLRTLDEQELTTIAGGSGGPTLNIYQPIAFAGDYGTVAVDHSTAQGGKMNNNVLDSFNPLSLFGSFPSAR
jgi:hypothetical protein